MTFLITWLVTAIATALAIAIVPGITAVGGPLVGPVFCALALALVNAGVKPVCKVLSLPLTIATLGIFRLVLNALMLELAGWLSVSLFGVGISIASFGAAFLGAMVISLASIPLDRMVGERPRLAA